MLPSFNKYFTSSVLLIVTVTFNYSATGCSSSYFCICLTSEKVKGSDHRVFKLVVG